MLLHNALDDTKAITVTAMFYSLQYNCKLVTLNLQKIHTDFRSKIN